MEQPAKKTRGKQVIEIKKIENESDRMVTFSKRKAGIIKKASELSILTGAQVGFLVFSPSGKPFSFGNPSIQAVSNRFLGVNPPPDDDNNPFFVAHRQQRIQALSHYHNHLLSELNAEKERGEKIEEMTKGKNTRGWWDAPTGELNEEELHHMNKALEDLRKMLHEKMNPGGGGASSSSFHPMNNIHQMGSQFPQDNPQS